MMSCSDRRACPAHDPRIGPIRGFSLIEMLAVVLVMALVAGVATTQFSRSPRATLAAETRVIGAILRQARQVAATSGTAQSVLFDLDARQVVWGAKTHDLPADVSLDLTALASEARGAKQAAIRFHPDGIATGGSLTLGLGDIETRVSVHWLGGGVAASE